MANANLRGVSTAVKKDGTTYYRSSITHQNKHISLGSYDSPFDAHQAYWEAAILLTKKDMSISDYNPDRMLDYRKWVILVNFRDNDLYITAPIYLRPNYFEYHLSPGNVLKFSTDDLFYYSKKQIMQRGRHFFVADYGMQVNILNRYGIKNYAVEGRDFIFKNGDNMDFRYDNIKIINSYHGVTSKMTKNGMRYTARIHIIGNYTIGRYYSEAEAAIAYNKAIDILKSKGVNKKFSQNYLADIPASEYARIYSEIKISKKVLNFVPKT
ncbi:MAG: hypothetical protein K6A38_01390 [Lachnospiraceae bacterium]|nr:hypothetical protein [Lachnospiraceae bacterium]